MSEESSNNMTTSNIRIRPMIPTDAPYICQIWCNGLDQTTESCQWNISKYLVSHMMNKLKEHANVGPDGSNLVKHWMDKSDRVMLVAECTQDDNDGDATSTTSTTKPQQIVVGCCGVKIGTSESEVGPESDIGSVWRVSVDKSARSKGIGKALMTKAEQWISEKSCTKMQLVTGNRIAANFYKSIGYQKINRILDALDMPGWFEKTIS